MTTEELKQRVAIAVAFAEGKKIRFRKSYTDWTPFHAVNHECGPDIFNPSLLWDVEPEPPKPREWWIVEPKGGPPWCSTEKPSFAATHVREVLE